MTNKKLCAYCGNEFEYTVHGGTTRKYCCLGCQRKATIENRNNRHKDLLSNYNHKGYLSKAIIILYGGRCAICNWRATEELLQTEKGIQYAYGNEIHHIIPAAKGGKSDFTNLILLCPNHHKQADLGIISPDQLRTYLKESMTEEEKQAAINKSIDRIAAAIF